MADGFIYGFIYTHLTVILLFRTNYAARITEQTAKQTKYINTLQKQTCLQTLKFRNVHSTQYSRVELLPRIFTHAHYEHMT